MIFVLVFFALFYTVTDTFFWDLPGEIAAAPASALCGWKSVSILSLSIPGRPLPTSLCTAAIAP